MKDLWKQLPLSFHDRSHFDGSCSRMGHLQGDLNGGVEVPCLNEQELNELLLSPGDRAVAERWNAIHDPYCESGIALQSLDVDQVKAADQVLFAGPARRLEGGALTGRHGFPSCLIPIRQQHILHHLCPMPLRGRCADLPDVAISS